MRTRPVWSQARRLTSASPFFLWVLGGLYSESLFAQTSYPMITHATPPAVQRGRSSEVVVEGQMDFSGVYKVLFEGVGISAAVLPGEPPKPPPTQRPRRAQPFSGVKLKVTVAPDAPLGIREFRVASPLGLSSVGQLVIVDDPVVAEKEPNNTPGQATPVSPPCVACGQIGREDLDCFKFHARAGQTFAFEVRCARIQDKIHDLQKHADPLLTLYDAEGRELAANDDFYFADPYLAYTMTKDGDYVVQVRDAKYDGDRRWVYALTVTDRPYATHVFPPAGKPGQKIEVEPVGPAKALRAKVVIEPPKEPGLHALQFDCGGVKSNPVGFLVGNSPQVVEQEPNDTPAQATKISVPSGVSGRVGRRGDLDHFAFKGTKGRAVRFEVKARRFGTVLQSGLDSVLDVLDRKGQVIASNDDAFGKDSALTFTPPSDGDYCLRVRDLNNKGGETFVYHVEADWAVPDFTLRCDPDKAMVGPGSSAAWYVHVARANGFAGPVQVEIKGLLTGMTASPLTIPPSMTQGVVVLTAAKDAPRDAAAVQVVGSAVVPTSGGKTETQTRLATPNEEIYLPGGGRGRFDVNLQAVAVTGPSDIELVEVKQHEVVLKPGGEARIDVSIKRRPNYNKDVNLDVLLSHLGGVFGNPLPPGVTVDEGKSKTALRTGSQGHIVLRAAPNAAPIEAVPVSVLAHVSINFVVKVSYASAPVLVSVKK